MQFIECERYECKVGQNFCGIMFEKVKLEFWMAYVNMGRMNLQWWFNSSKIIPI